MGVQLVNTGGCGINIPNEDALVIARGGDISQGDLVAFCISNADDKITADGLTPTFAPGTTNSIFSCVTKAYADATVQSGWFAVALEDIKDEKIGRVRVRGIVPEAYSLRYQGAAYSYGTQGVAGTTSTYNPTSGGSQYSNAVPTTVGSIDFAFGSASAAVTSTYSPKIIAIAMSVVAASGSSTSTKRRVLFDGINGFGGTNTV